MYTRSGCGRSAVAVRRSREPSEAYRLAREAAEGQLQHHQQPTSSLAVIRAQLWRERLSLRRELRGVQVRLDETTGRLHAIAAELADRTEVE
jgi:hypothetical protein